MPPPLMPADANAAWSSREHATALVCFGLFTGLIAVFLLRDASAFVSSQRDQLIGHVGASGGFTVAAAGTLLVLRRHRPHVLEIMAAGVAVTVVLELAQAFAPTRGVELGDIAAGFSGVLVATVGIEILLAIASVLAASRVHVAMAVAGSAILLTLLLFDLAPETLSSATPDGISCPLTTLTGGRTRIVLGADLRIEDGCLVTTEAGGLSLFGPTDATSLEAESVLISSAIDDVLPDIVANERVVLRARVVTGEFSGESFFPGIIASIRLPDGGDLIQLRTRDQRVESLGTSLVTDYRAISFVQVLAPNTDYLLELEMSRTELRTSVDGDLLGISAVDPAWVDELRAIQSEGSQLFIGNGPGRTFPFDGIIEWVEIEA